MTTNKTISAYGYLVNNVPEYALNKPYIIAQYTFDKDNDPTLWFYGAWDDEDKAYEAFEELRPYGYIEFIVNK